MITAVPTINTKRLSLCALRLTDFERYAEIWAMSEVVRYIGAPRSRSVAWKAFLQTAGHWQLAGFGQWAITRRTDNTLIGQTGFFYAARELGEDLTLFPRLAGY